MDCFAALAMTVRRDSAISPHEFFCARYSFIPALRNEGAGNAGRPMRPIAVCAMVVGRAHTRWQVTPESPGIPHAMVLRLLRARPGAPGLLATVIRVP